MNKWVEEKGYGHSRQRDYEYIWHSHGTAQHLGKYKYLGMNGINDIFKKIGLSKFREVDRRIFMKDFTS